MMAAIEPSQPYNLLLAGLSTSLTQALIEQGMVAPHYELYAATASGADFATTLSLIDVAIIQPSTTSIPISIVQEWRELGLVAPILLLADQHYQDWPVTERVSLPLRLGSLSERIHYYCRLRTTRESPVVLCWSNYSLDTNGKKLSRGEFSQNLTDKETALLAALVQEPKPWSREALLRQLWGHEAALATHTLETHIYQLRRKLSALSTPDEAGAADIITTEYGYQLQWH